MSNARIESLARQFLDTLDGAQCVPLPSASAAGLSTAEAYAVADRLRGLRIARGERPVGWKIGFTQPQPVAALRRRPADVGAGVGPHATLARRRRDPGCHCRA